MMGGGGEPVGRRMKLGIKRGFGVGERDYIVMEDKVMILNWGFCFDFVFTYSAA